jgi:plasmid stability protein
MQASVTKARRDSARFSKSLAKRRLRPNQEKDAFEDDAQGLLTAVYKDTTQPIELRLAAAKTAITFEKRRIAAIVAKIEDNEFERMTEDELRDLIRAGLENIPELKFTWASTKPRP